MKRDVRREGGGDYLLTHFLGVVIFSCWVQIFSRGVQQISVGVFQKVWLKFFREGLIFFREGLIFLGEGLIFCREGLGLRGVPRIWQGGAKNFFFQIWKFACREATCCAWRSHVLC